MHLGSSTPLAPRSATVRDDRAAEVLTPRCLQGSHPLRTGASFSLVRNNRLLTAVSPRGTPDPFCGQNEDLLGGDPSDCRR